MLDVDHSTIARWEAGQGVSPEMLQRLANAFKCESWEIVTTGPEQIAPG